MVEVWFCGDTEPQVILKRDGNQFKAIDGYHYAQHNEEKVIISLDKVSPVLIHIKNYLDRKIVNGEFCHMGGADYLNNVCATYEHHIIFAHFNKDGEVENEIDPGWKFSDPLLHEKIANVFLIS